MFAFRFCFPFSAFCFPFSVFHFLFTSLIPSQFCLFTLRSSCPRFLFSIFHFCFPFLFSVFCVPFSAFCFLFTSLIPSQFCLFTLRGSFPRDSSSITWCVSLPPVAPSRSFNYSSWIKTVWNSKERELTLPCAFWHFSVKVWFQLLRSKKKTKVKALF